MELSPETCRVKPLRRINAIVAFYWIYFTVTLISLLSGLLSPFCCRREGERERGVVLFNDAGHLLKSCCVGDVWMECEYGPLVEWF